MSRQRITKKQQIIIDALEQTMGNVSGAVELLRQKGISVERSTHYKAMRDNEKYQEAYTLMMEKNIDIAEGKLLKKVNEGDFKAVTYYLDSKGQDRGYGRKVEIKGSSTDPIFVQQTTAEEIENARQNLKEHFDK